MIDYRGYDQLVGEARLAADEIDQKHSVGHEPTEDANLLRRLADHLEARRDRHFWRARAIRMEEERDAARAAAWDEGWEVGNEYSLLVEHEDVDEAPQYAKETNPYRGGDRG